MTFSKPFVHIMKNKWPRFVLAFSNSIIVLDLDPVRNDFLVRRLLVPPIPMEFPATMTTIPIVALKWLLVGSDCSSSAPIAALVRRLRLQVARSLKLSREGDEEERRSRPSFTVALSRSRDGSSTMEKTMVGFARKREAESETRTGEGFLRSIGCRVKKER
ncbi:hypothetical protein LXL04_007928 [Taraxacum kok-saghyz]